MKKKIQKPFDVEAAKRGAKVETKDGIPVRIICYDRADGIYPIIALVNNYGHDTCNGYTSDGKLFCNGPGEHDLVLVEEVEETKFKEGDYIVLNQKVTSLYYIYKVYYIDTMYHTYHLVDINNNSFIRQDIEEVDKSYHKWTLKDAKPGDVLICEGDDHPFIFKESFGGSPTTYCGIDTTSSIYIGSGGVWTRGSVRPATYEEKQQFFNKLEEGYKWDVESLTLTKISKRWRDNEDAPVNGYCIGLCGCISEVESHESVTYRIYPNTFATEKQAKSALAMARISQIIKNDERFGGVVTDEEWDERSWYNIIRVKKALIVRPRTTYEFLSFHTSEQANLFLQENEDLIRDYYMMN